MIAIIDFILWLSKTCFLYCTVKEEHWNTFGTLLSEVLAWEPFAWNDDYCPYANETEKKGTKKLMVPQNFQMPEF